jgi:hypothetical protein
MQGSDLMKFQKPQKGTESTKVFRQIICAFCASLWHFRFCEASLGVFMAAA